MRKVVTSLLCALLFAGCFMRKDNSAGFAAYEKDTFLMMLYCDNRRDPEKLMTRLKEELIPTVWVDE